MKSTTPGKVRLIAGRWRNSRLDVVDRPGLRPTSERVRETLFNWLQSRIAGARCLDLFAGTGALGLEAASRGAAEVLLLERDPVLAQHLRAHVQRLQAAQVQVVAADALAWMGGSSQRFDLVFVDPPFALGLWNQALAALVPLLADDARVYVESGAESALQIPAGWDLLREGRTREVRYALYAVKAEAPVTLTPGMGNDKSST